MTTDSKTAGKKPDYNVYASGDGDKAPNLKVGAAWKVAKDGISISMFATPVNGKVVLFPTKEDDAE